MKATALILASLIAVPALAQTPAAAANPGVDAAKTTFTIMSRYFTAAAEQVPEADYSFRPVETVRTVGQLIGHMAGANNMFCAAALGEAPKGEDDIEKTVTTKAGLVAALKASNEYCARAYAMTDAASAGRTMLFGQDQSKAFALSLNAAHVAEHYGNMVTYMRMKGLVPPSSQPPGGQ
jgi:uncharacterized damage-inducible protein DinB